MTSKHGKESYNVFFFITSSSHDMVFINYDSDDAVVCKPWENSKTMVTLGDDEYKSILCLDGYYFEAMRRMDQPAYINRC